MNITAHIHTLEEKHTWLKEEVKAESSRPLPDFTRITELKKQKLHIKEEIQKLYMSLPQEALAG